LTRSGSSTRTATQKLAALAGGLVGGRGAEALLADLDLRDLAGGELLLELAVGDLSARGGRAKQQHGGEQPQEQVDHPGAPAATLGVA
jgi:hypothetical protein